MKKYKNFQKQGQSLMEILIATAVGVIIIGVAAAIITPILKVNTTTNESKISSGLGRELLENIKVMAESSWSSISSLATGTTNIFHLTTTTPPFVVVGGVEYMQFSTSTYFRYFYVDDVCRDSVFGGVTVTDCGNGGAQLDFSSKKISVSYGWIGGGSTSTFLTYLTQAKNGAIIQSDWSGGQSLVLPPVTTTTNNFSTSSNIDYDSTRGSIRIKGI